MSEFQWWFSQDREAWNGPFATKDQAIGEGRGLWDKESFYICEARMEDYRQLTVDPDQVLEQVSDNYEEFWGPEEGLFADVSSSFTEELGRMLSATLHEWIEQLDIKTGIGSFAETRNEEVIEPVEK